MIDFDSLLANVNVKAFLRVIREGETGHTDEAYKTIVGGGHFDNFADHPRVRVWIQRLNVYSTAAGAYQFLQATWDDLVKRYNLPDFSPHSQDCGAVALLNDCGALEPLLAGHLTAAIAKANRIWASLPGDVYGQGGISAQRARAVYLAWGGVEAEGEAAIATGPAAPATGPSKPISEDKPMPAPLALIGPILSVITELIPALSTLFGKNAEKYKDKIGAATQVVEVVTRAVGATNAQEAIEKIEKDPAALATARAAIVTDPIIGPMLTEVGGGIVAARGWDADPMRPKFWLSGAFWMAVLLAPLLYITTVRVLWGGFSEQLQTVVVTAILSGLLGSLTGFFFGAMFNSSRNATQTQIERN